MLEVKQEDRAAAAAEFARRFGGTMQDHREIVDDDHPIVQAFARHRQSAEGAAIERCAQIADAAWVPAYARFDNGEWTPASPYDRGAVDAGSRITAAIRALRIQKD